MAALPGSQLRSASQVVFDPDERRAAIERFSAEIFNASAVDLALRASRSEALHPESPLLAAIILRAGRNVPPGLSVARRAQRQARSLEALEWLRTALADPVTSVGIQEALRAALRRSSGQAGGMVEGQQPSGGDMPDLAAAAMNVAASLDLVDFAPPIAGYLGDTPWIAAKARSALHRLLGRHFVDLAAFEQSWSSLEGLDSVSLARDELLASQRRGDQLALKLIEYAPETIEGDALDFDDPTSAALAARATARAVAGGRLAPDVALRLFGETIESEPRTAPFAARIAGMLDLVQGADPDSESAQFVSQCFSRLAAPGLPVEPDLAWITIGGLPRLVYPAAAKGGDEVRAKSLATGLALFKRVLAAEERRPLDPDALQVAIGALIDLAGSIEDDAVRARHARALVEQLLDFVTTSRPLSAGVRRAAAAGLRLSLEREDADVLLGLVESMTTPELEYELLGALKTAIAVLQESGADAEPVIDRLFEISAAPEFDRKMRALSVLGADDVAKALRSKPRRTRALWILARLELEETPEVQAALLRVFEQVADGEVLDKLVNDGELLRRIANGGSASIESFESTVRSVSSGEPALMRKVANAVIAAGAGRFGERAAPEGPRARERRSARLAVLRSGLRLALEADVMPGQVLAAADHARIVRAALELLRLEPLAGAAWTLDTGELRALRETHIAGLVNSDSGLYDFELMAATALIDARLAVRAPTATPGNGRVSDAVVEAFDRAIASFDETATGEATAESSGESEAQLERFGWTRAALSFESIEFLRAVRRGPEALARFDSWIASRPQAAGALDVSTARSYCDLALDVAGEAPAQLTLERAERIVSLLDSIVAQVKLTGEERAASDPIVNWLSASLAKERAGADVFARVASSVNSEGYRAVLERVHALDGPEKGADKDAAVDEGEAGGGGSDSSDGVEGEAGDAEKKRSDDSSDQLP